MQAGLDSLGAVELRSALSRAFGLDAPATLAFDYPTLQSLAAYVEQSTVAPAALDLAHSMQHTLSGSSSISSISGVAVVAVSCRYPTPTNSTPSHAAGGNADFAAFQHALEAGANIQCAVPPQRWDVDSVYHPGRCCAQGCACAPQVRLLTHGPPSTLLQTPRLAACMCGMEGGSPTLPRLMPPHSD